MAPVPFPLSSTPGLRPGEGEGRLINAYSEKAGNTIYVRRSAGLAGFMEVGASGPRGLFDLDGTVYAAFAGAVVWARSGTGFNLLAGDVPYLDGVTWARNNRVTGGVSTPDLVAVREGGGAYLVTSTTVSAYPDGDLPATVNSVAFMDGFFLFTLPDGRIFASELNSTDVNALSFATAEGKPDGLKRGIVHGGVFYAMGANSIEPWLNVGNSPFPLVRGTSILSIGLLTTMAVAGFELGWDHEPYFVAHDGTVHVLRGYQTEKVSTPDVDAFVAASTVESLEACVYTAKGNAFWVLSSDAGTWELNISTGLWNERESTGAAGRWRGSRSVKCDGVWVVGDILSTSLLAVSDAIRTENGAAVTWTIESAPVKEYPIRIAIPALYGDFTQADDVSMAVSWSHNGGGSWSAPVARALANADRFPVGVNRVGVSTQHGLRARYSTDAAGDFSFLGASVPDPQGRAP